MKDNKHNPSPIAPASTAPSKAAATARNASAEGTSGKLMKKKGAQAGDPYAQPKGKRANVKAKGGRAYGITASMPAWSDPAIAAVQSNGRVFTAALNRTAPNFQSGASDLN